MLKNGEIGGKLVCPNEKCGIKIGNFDWAGVQCGCKEWVTPVSAVIRRQGAHVGLMLFHLDRASVSIGARWTRCGDVSLVSFMLDFIDHVHGIAHTLHVHLMHLLL